MIGILRAYGLAIPPAVLLLVATACQRLTEVRIEKYSSAGCSSIDVGTLNGDIAVHPVDGDSIVARITIETFGGSGALSDVKVIFTPGARANLEASGPSGLFGAATISLDVGIPRSVMVGSLETTNGDVSSVGMTHDGLLGTTNGDVSMSACAGTAQLSTTNGDLSVSGGSLIVLEASGMNGDVMIDAGGLPANGATFETTNGSVHVSLPAGLSCVVEMSTTNGDTGVSGLQFSGDLDDGGRITVGQGGPLLVLETVNGDVELSGRTTP
jgi:DUF4097 and DUF4098 domain-containing protein YvlB